MWHRDQKHRIIWEFVINAGAAPGPQSHSVPFIKSPPRDQFDKHCPKIIQIRALRKADWPHEEYDTWGTKRVQ